MGAIDEGAAGAATESFHMAFDAFAQAIRRARGTAARDGDSLSFSQYALLRALAGRSGARIGDLATDAAISPSTATRILDALERRAIVRRDRTKSDRRVVTVTLTDRGRAALSRQDAWMRGRQAAFFTALPDAERLLAPRLLLALAGLIEELTAGPGD